MKKTVFTIIKLSITAIILFFIFRRIDLSQTIRLITGISAKTILLLLLTAVLKQVTQFVNWNFCLRINDGYRPEVSETLNSMFIGSALRFLIPGGHATYGKVYYLNYSKIGTAISITMEKFMLTWSVLLFGAIATMFYFTRFSLILRIVILTVVAIIPLLLSKVRFVFPKYSGYFDNCLNIVPVMTIVQAVYVSLTVLQYYMIINNFVCLPFTAALLAVPLILTANTIPITYSGLGMRESFSIYMLSNFGISPEIAVTASLLVFMINAVIPAIIGIILILTSSIAAKKK